MEVVPRLPGSVFTPQLVISEVPAHVLGVAPGEEAQPLDPQTGGLSLQRIEVYEDLPVETHARPLTLITLL